MRHLSKRPAKLFTALQAMTVALALFGTWFAGLLGFLGIAAIRMIFHEEPTTLSAKVFVVCAVAAVVGVSVCCYIALGSFFTLLQRMKKETAFTRRNTKALGRIALSCLAAAAMLFMLMGYISFGVFLPTRSFTGSVWQFMETFCMLMLWPFGFGLVGLLVQGVRVLMDRALALEEEQELVV